MSEKSDKWKCTAQLFDIVMELEARGVLGYVGIPDLKKKSWEEICDDGIKLFERLKEINIYEAWSKEEWDRYNEEFKTRTGAISNH